jgi:hypothetical protein
MFLYFCLLFYFGLSFFIPCAGFSYLFGMKKIIWYKFTKKKKVQFKGPVTTRECDGWKWQRILAVETCRVAWCAHQLWLPRADPLSVQLQHPPRVQTRANTVASSPQGTPDMAGMKLLYKGMKKIKFF